MAAVAALAILLLVSAVAWIARGRSGDEHLAIRVAVQPFEALSDSGTFMRWREESLTKWWTPLATARSRRSSLESKGLAARRR